MKSKYSVMPDGYNMSIYLLPAPADGIDTVQSGQNQCCAATAAGGRTGAIRLLARSAPVWKATNLTSSLGLPKTGDNYHAKVLVSEYIPIGHYSVQDRRASGGWQYYSAPEWFVQGLQEYDAIFHSTDSNRTMTSKRLLQWAKANSTKFWCCSPNLTIADPYNGGATFMAFLVAEFGEGVHARLLRNPANTFEAALASETQPYQPQQWILPFLVKEAGTPETLFTTFGTNRDPVLLDSRKQFGFYLGCYGRAYWVEPHHVVEEEQATPVLYAALAISAGSISSALASSAGRSHYGAASNVTP